MATKVSKTFGKAGEGSAVASGSPTLKDVLVEMITDMTALATSLNALLSDYNGHDHTASATAQDASSATSVTLGTSYE